MGKDAPSIERLFGINEAAFRLGTSYRSVMRLIRRGTLAPVRLPGVRRVLLDPHDLDALIAAAKAQPASLDRAPA